MASSRAPSSKRRSPSAPQFTVHLEMARQPSTKLSHPMDMQLWVRVFFRCETCEFVAAANFICLMLKYVKITIGSGGFLCVTYRSYRVFHVQQQTASMAFLWALWPTHSHHGANPAIGNGPSLVVRVGLDSPGTSMENQVCHQQSRTNFVRKKREETWGNMSRFIDLGWWNIVI